MNTTVLRDAMLGMVTDSSVTTSKGTLIGLISYAKAKLAKDPMNDYLLGRLDAMLDMYAKLTGTDYDGADDTKLWSDQISADFNDILDGNTKDQAA